jgi:ribosomal 50S subunit-associated protein YjgA (DUF615 family)
MAERVIQRSKRHSAPPRQAARVAPVEVKRNSKAAVEALERERDELKSQLAAARASIIKLEQARDEAVNRIDWAIDSLHNLLESDA